MSIDILLLGAGDAAVLDAVAADVFDHDVQPGLLAEFLADPRHHLAVARDGGRVVGFASAVHYVHPDKPPELWINEVGVAPTHQGRGVGRQLLRAICDAGRAAGCRQAWVLTDRSNAPALRLYESAGGVAAPGQTVMFEFALDEAPAESAPARDAATETPGVRLMRRADAAAVAGMMRALWPDAGDYDFGGETVFVWDRADGRLGGFISVALRPWAEGCDSVPVPYIEGWWVVPDLRRRGVGRALVRAVERWCGDHNFRELGSDVELANDGSLAAHAALGFEPTLQLQFFRKRLDGGR